MLEGFDTADNRALVLDMQARLSLDALGKGIESALVSPATLVPEPWLASSEVLSGLGPDAMAVDTHLVPNVQVSIIPGPVFRITLQGFGLLAFRIYLTPFFRRSVSRFLSILTLNGSAPVVTYKRAYIRRSCS